ncbi:MAG TPA: glycosyltransferase [Acidimicrobiales bacterium]|nr:glycosyltransferase [Acidimicrobiales bacterium]
MAAGTRTGWLEHRRRYGDAIPTAALLSFRLGGSDGVAVEAAKWQAALTALGFSTLTVAGDGPVDRVLPGLAIGAAEPPTRSELVAVLDDADLVVVENVCSLPLNPGAAEAVAGVLAGRAAILHHHDLPWQRSRFAGHPPPPVDGRWSQVTINELSRRQLADRGIVATTVYNSFALGPAGAGATTGRGEDDDLRRQARAALGIADGQRLVLQPTRAIPRKNVGGGIRVATELGATFWLLGPAEDGFGPQLAELVGGAGCPVILGTPGGAPDVEIHAAYRACDVVALPSTWEGFGNPSIESVVHRRPLAIGPYPVADELAAFGFEWFSLAEMDRLGAWLDAPDPGLLDRNVAVASAHFSLDDLPERITSVLPEL